jgi:arsenate reductase (glutaredoxin)
MKQITFYHNPRCGKSREALAILEKEGIRPKIVEYLKTPPSFPVLERIIERLGVEPRDLMRKKEKEYRALKLDRASLSRRELIEAMVRHPILIERPIAVSGNKAVVARPPEKVIGLL